MKASLLGLDGLPPWLLRKAAESLDLPFLSRALGEGRLLDLYSMPPVTPTAWTSIATGVGPAKHGVWGFIKYYREDGKHMARPYTALDVMFPRTFEDAALKGLEVLAVNWPLTWPLRALCCLDRMIIVGDTFLAPRVEYWPGGLEKGYSRYFRTHEEAQDPYERTKLMVEGSLRLLSEVDVDTAMIMLPFPDQAFHVDYRETLSVGPKSAEVWRAIDGLAEEMARRSDSLIIVSDHGIGVYSDFFVNVLAPYMKATGFGLPMTLRGRLLLSMASIADSLSKRLPPGMSPRLLAREGYLGPLRKAFERDVTSPVKIVDPESSVKAIGESDLARAPFTYDTGRGLSMSRIVLFRDELEREKFIKALESSEATRYLRVYRVEERFRGAYLPEYPSIMIESVDENRYHPVSTRSLALLRRDVMPDHHVIGTLLVYGKGAAALRPGSQSARVEDVGPTLLALLGLPVPRGADGVSLVGEPAGSYPYDAAARLRRRHLASG